LDRAIEIAVPGATFGVREGVDAKGRTARLALDPISAGEANVDIAILFDRSGSTNSRVFDRATKEASNGGQ
jgi:hypothetical protein